MSDIKVTRKTARLLRHMLAYHEVLDSPVTGITAWRVGGVGPGSFYPLTARLEQAGWVYSEWEVLPAGEDRPRRRYYFLTEEGARWAGQAVKEYDGRKSWWKRLLKVLDDISDEGDD